MKLLNITLLILLLFTTGYAETLEELQNTAVSKRKIIDRYKTNVEKAEKTISLAQKGYYPSVDLQYAFNDVDGNVLAENEENSVIYGALTWNLFAGFRDKYNIKSARLLHQVERYKLQGVKQDIKYDVSLYYLNIFQQQANLKVTQDAYNTLKKIYQDESYRFEMGMVKKNDLLSIKVDLDNAEINMKKAEVNLKKSALLLQRKMDTEVDVTLFNFTEFKTLPDTESYDTVLSRMLTKRSDLLAYEDSIKATQMNAKSKQSAYYPKVDLTSSYRKYDDSYYSGSGDTYSEEMRHQVVVSINLFDGFGKYNEIDRARLEAKGIQYDLYELKRDLKTDLKNMFLDFEVSTENADVAKSSIKQAEENLRITELSYKEGISRTIDLLNAITTLSRAKYNYVAAKRDVFINYFRITRAEETF